MSGMPPFHRSSHHQHFRKKEKARRRLQERGREEKGQKEGRR